MGSRIQPRRAWAYVHDGWIPLNTGEGVPLSITLYLRVPEGRKYAKNEMRPTWFELRPVNARRTAKPAKPATTRRASGGTRPGASGGRR